MISLNAPLNQYVRLYTLITLFILSTSFFHLSAQDQTSHSPDSSASSGSSGNEESGWLGETQEKEGFSITLEYNTPIIALSEPVTLRIVCRGPLESRFTSVFLIEDSPLWVQNSSHRKIIREDHERVEITTIQLYSNIPGRNYIPEATLFFELDDRSKNLTVGPVPLDLPILWNPEKGGELLRDIGYTGTSGLSGYLWFLLLIPVLAAAALLIYRFRKKEVQSKQIIFSDRINELRIKENRRMSSDDIPLIKDFLTHYHKMNPQSSLMDLYKSVSQWQPHYTLKEYQNLKTILETGIAVQYRGYEPSPEEEDFIIQVITDLILSREGSA